MLSIKILYLVGVIALIVDCFHLPSPERDLLRHQCGRLSWKRKFFVVNSDQIPSSPYDVKRKNFGLFVKIASAAIGSSLIDSRPSIAVDLPECSDSVTLFQRSSDKKSVILIGTAHISEDSVNLVRRTIRSVKPDVVMIELDSKRIGRAGVSKQTLNEAGFDFPMYGTKQFPVAALQTPVSDVKAQAFINLMVGTLAATVQDWIADAGGALLGRALSEFYKSIEKLGFTAGGEFKAAVEEGRAVGARILLGDRDVDFTLQRLAAAVSSTDTAA
jgi:TraB/PrgY/gumN family